MGKLIDNLFILNTLKVEASIEATPDAGHVAHYFEVVDGALGSLVGLAVTDEKTVEAPVDAIVGDLPTEDLPTNPTSPEAIANLGFVAQSFAATNQQFTVDA